MWVGMTMPLIPLSKIFSGVENFRFVEATFVEETAVEEGTLPPEALPAEHPGWALSADMGGALDNLSSLLGKRYSPVHLAASEKLAASEPFQALERTRFVTDLRRKLASEGAQSFPEILARRAGLVPPGFPMEQLEALAKGYLSAIAFLNFRARSQKTPLLDFRVHLWLRMIGGFLKRCLHCHRYHVGLQEFCQECGFPLFDVYRHNIEQCVGKVAGHRLSWTLKNTSDDPPGTYYVLLSPAGKQGDTTEDSLHFDTTLGAVDEALQLVFNDNGALHVTLLPHLDYNEVKSLLLPLTGRFADYQYLSQLVVQLLDFMPARERKLLGFLDNREGVSRYARILRDNFASAFFEGYLRLNDPDGIFSPRSSPG